MDYFITMKRFFYVVFICFFSVFSIYAQTDEDWNPDHLDADEQRETIRVLQIINDKAEFRENFFSQEGKLDEIKNVLSYQGSRVVNTLKKLDYYGSLQKITNTWNGVIVPAAKYVGNAAAPVVKAVGEAAAPAAKAVKEATAPAVKAVKEAAAPAAKALDDAAKSLAEQAKNFIKNNTGQGSSSGSASPSPPKPAAPQKEPEINPALPEGVRANIVNADEEKAEERGRKTKSILESVPITDFAIDISDKVERSTDSLPAIRNSLMRFEIYNNTAIDGDYDVYFFDAKLDKARGDYELVSVKSGSKAICDLFATETAGIYKLEIRSHAGNALLAERNWEVR
jgi:hypothetical protein